MPATGVKAHPPVRREEIRFAVVLNGGVSLAVWMGGVVHELDAVTQSYDQDEVDVAHAAGDGAGPDHAYTRLMEALHLRARADVISGTSAGGINGAALALAQVNRRADLSMLRDLWAQQGRMETLLQRPFSGDPGSLLRGEEYFLPRLQEAMSRLSRNWDPRPAAERPVDLTITTTLLTGAVDTTTDSMGEVLPQLRFNGRFHFRRGFKEIRPTTEGGQIRYEEVDDDDFAGDEETAQRLGLAARCSAGFPMAFEPSYVPVGRAVDGRPDMAGFANWNDFGPAGADGVARDVSRFAVDGGVLSNTPTREALEAIQKLEAREPVQRVMMLVFPHAPGEISVAASEQASPPALPTGLVSMMSALRADGGRTHVELIEQHNRRASCRRATRTELLADPHLRTLAAQLFDSYRRLRIQRSARDLPDLIHLPASWSFERTRGAALEAQWAYEETYGRLPYVPRRLSSQASPSGGWGWGATAALDIADTAIGAVDAIRATWRTPQLDEVSERIHAQMTEIRLARAELDGPWQAMEFGTGRTAPGSPAGNPLDSPGPDLAYWQRRLDVYDYFMVGRELPQERIPAGLQDRCGSGGERTAQAVERIVDQLALAWATCPAERQPPQWGPLFAGVPTLPHGADAGWFEPTEAGWRARAGYRRLLRLRLLRLHVVSWTVGDENVGDNTRPLELVQLSAAARHHFADLSTTMADKLGGEGLARFSGFLKTSWRMNDWTWGRLDAAVMLLRVMLRPSRLCRFADEHGLAGTPQVRAEQVVDRLFEIVAGAPRPGALDGLRADAVTELAGILAADRPDDSMRSPRLAELLAYGRHVETILEDLPQVAAGVRADVADGSGERGAGVRFVQDNQALLREIESLGSLSGLDDAALVAAREGRLRLGLAALRALDRSGIGREETREVASTDQTIRTAMTTAAVLATLADSPAAGLSKLKPATKFVRGALLLPYWVTLGLTSASATARLLAVLALSFGAGVLALAVIGVLPDAVAAAGAMVGAGTTLLVVTYAAARTGSALHALTFVGAGIPLLAVGLERLPSGADSGGGSGPALAVLLVVLVVALLGCIPNPLGSPVALLGGVTHAGATLGRVLKLVVVVALGLVIVLLVANVLETPLAQVVDAVTGVWRRTPTWVIALGVVALMAVAWAATYWHTRTLAPVEWSTTSDTWNRRPILHPAAVFGAWSPVYGLLYGGAAAALWASGWIGKGWGSFGVATGIALTFVVPFLAVGLGRRAVVTRIRREMAVERRLGFGAPVQLAGDSSFARWLTTRDLRHTFLLSPGGTDARAPDLSRRGRRLRASLAGA